MSSPIRSPRSARRLSALAGLCVIAGVAFLAPASRAADDEDHLDFKKTYAAALLEARIRNVPVFVSRHKDF